MTESSPGTTDTRNRGPAAAGDPGPDHNGDVTQATPRKSAERPDYAKNVQRGPMGGQVHEKPMNFWPSLRRLLGHLAPERVRLILIVLMAVVGISMNVVGPKILGWGTDTLFTGILGRQIGSQFPPGTSKAEVVEALRASGQNQLAEMIAGMEGFVPGQGVDFTKLALILLLASGLFLLASAVLALQGQILNGVVQRSIYRLREQVEDKINRLPLSYFDRSPRGELLSRVTNDIDNISQTLQQTLSQLLTALLTVVGVLAMMFWISPVLAVIGLVTIPVAVLATGVIGKQAQKRFIRMWRHTGELNGQVEEGYTGHSLVKVFGRRKEVAAVFAEKNEELFQASFGAQFISGIMMPVMMFIGNINYVIIAVAGGIRVANGQISLGDVQAFIQYSRQFTQPLTQVASMATLLQSGVASAERVFEVLDEEEQLPESDADLPATRGRVEFEHVDFSYDPNISLITDLSLVAEPGQTVAIVGPTGAGKTTLVNLIMRFYELRGGRITLDHRDISSVPRSELRSKVGMVLQDAWLFHGTIRDNIAYGRPDAGEEEILAAAEATYVDRFVHSLPDGYDTMIDEEGSNVSAGEQQLLTIARAFLADPALLILDEATSSVDTRTELLVQQAMSRLRTGRTSFVIAHRLSTIRDADVILVMQHGEIVEQGDHDALLEARGAYFDLYNSQFNNPDEELDDAAQPEPALRG
jgi:ATP-binding cassette, subfamily B, multidrug efflux pump